MLQEVPLAQKSLADYTHLVGRELVESIRELAGPLEGKRVLHVSATAFGGGVSEILYTIVPLMRDVGLDAHWNVILGREEFFNVTKLMHNSLQGDPEAISPEQWELFERYNWMNAQSLTEDAWDVIIVHDPQPVGLRHNLPEAAKKWIWRCHIDVSTPNEETLGLIKPLVEEYDASVWHLQEYVPAGLAESANGSVNLIPPAIDPLSPKNMALSPDDASFVCEQFGIDVDRPLLTQVSRFDPWKDPMGVIDAYRMVAKEVPDVQLALVGSMATDDPEGWEFFHKTFEHAGEDPDIKILNNLNNVGAIEVNAFQSQSDVLIQKSIREGFGLTVTEALWKGRPTIGGDVGGIPLQVTDGESGFLVSSPEETAQRSLEILADPELGRRLGKAGKEHARKNFLSPRLLRDWLAALRRTRLLAASNARPGTLAAMPEEQPLIIVSNRGPAQFERTEEGERKVDRGGGGLVTALSGLVSHRKALWVASAMTDEDVAVAREADGKPVDINLGGIDYHVCMVESDSEAYDRFYNTIANPILWFIQHYLWDLSNAPDIRLEEIEAWEHGYKTVNDDIAQAVISQIEGHRRAPRDDPRLPALHLPGDDPRSPPRRLPAPVRPHPLVAARLVADPAPGLARGDLPRLARQRHHRLPHLRLRAQLPALLRGPDGARDRLGAPGGPPRAGRDLGSRLSARDRRRAAARGGGLRSGRRI